MAQSVSKVVDVDITISPKAAPTQGFGTLCVFGDSDVISPTERYRTYTNLNEVVGDFGLAAPEYKAAELYFSQDPAPDQLMIARWNRYGTPAELVGGYLTKEQQDISQWQRITNGSLSFDLNGQNIDILNLDFSGQTNLNGVAEVINQKLDGAQIKWTGEKFILTTDEVGADQNLSYMFFSDKQENIHKMLGLAEGQATLIPGTDYVPAVPEQPATSGFLTGTDISAAIDTLKEVKNGSFKITVNDIEVPVNNLDFTSAKGLGTDKAMVEIAKVLDRALKPTASVSAEAGHFVITSNSVGENSIVEKPAEGESYPVSAGYLTGTNLTTGSGLTSLQQVMASSGDDVLTSLQQVTDGSFDISIDGQTIHVTDLNLSNDGSFDEMAQTIEENLQGHGTVDYDGDHFVVTSNTIGTSSKVLRATAGQIKGVKPGFLTGTSISGSGSMSAIKAVKDGSIRIPIDNDTVSLTHLDFSQASNLDAVANVLTAGLAGRGSAKAQGDQIVVTSSTLGSQSKVLKALAGEKYETGGTNGYLTGTTVVSGSISTLQEVENGSLKVQIDGTERSLKNINLSDAESMAEVAAALQAKLNPYAKVEYVTDHFVITSNSTGTTSTVSKATAGEYYDAEEATAGFLTGTSITSKLDELKKVTDGSFNINIDGSLVQIKDLDFSQAKSIQDIVDVLYDHLNEHAVISFSGDQIIITSKTTGASSSVNNAAEGELIEVGKTSGYLTGSETPTDDLETIKAVTDGSMKIAIDGDTKSLTNLNFSNAVDMGGIANILETSLAGAGTVDYIDDHFVVTSATTGESSTVAAATEGEKVVVGGTSGYATSANLTNAANLQSIKQIDKGTMKIQVDSQPLNLTGLDFSQVNSFDDVANVLRPKLASYANVECISGSGDEFNLKITSLTSGGSSLVSYATEGDPVYEETAAKLTSAEITESGTAAYIEALQAVKNGNFKIAIDGETVSVTALNFSSCDDLNDIASVVGDALTGHATVGIESAGSGSYLTITSNTTGASSTIAKATTGSGSTISADAELKSIADIPLETFTSITDGRVELYYTRGDWKNRLLSYLTDLDFSSCKSYQDVADVINNRCLYPICFYSNEERCFVFKDKSIHIRRYFHQKTSQNTPDYIDPNYYPGLGIATENSTFIGHDILEPDTLLTRLKSINAGFVFYDEPTYGAHISCQKVDFSTCTSLEDVCSKFNSSLEIDPEMSDYGLHWDGRRFYANYDGINSRKNPTFLGVYSKNNLTYFNSLKTYLNAYSGYQLSMSYSMGNNVSEVLQAWPWLIESGDIYITINDQPKTRVTLPPLKELDILVAVDERDSYYYDQHVLNNVVAKINNGLAAAGISDRVTFFANTNTAYFISTKTGTSSRLVIELPEDDDTFSDLVSLFNTSIQASEDIQGLELDIWGILGFNPGYSYGDTEIANIFFDIGSDYEIEATGQEISPKNNLHTLLGIGTTATVTQGTAADEPTEDNQLYLRLGLNDGSAILQQGEDIFNHYNVHELLGLADGTPTEGGVLYNDNQLHIKLGLSDGTPTPGQDAVKCDNQLHSKLGLANGTSTNGVPIYSVTDLHTKLGLANGTETPGEDNDNQLHIKLGLANGTETSGKNNENNLHILLGLLYGASTPGHDTIPEIPAKDATPGRIIGGPIDFEALQEVIDGNFGITIDGSIDNEITQLNLTGITTAVGLAEVLNRYLDGAVAAAGQPAGAIVRFSGSDSGNLILTSKTTGANSSVSYATGLDLLKYGIADLLLMTEDKATSLTPGLDPESPAETVSVMTQETADWYGGVIASDNMPSDDEQLEICQFIEGQSDIAHIWGLTITDKRILDRVYTNDLASRCKELGLNRTVAMYSSNSPYAICAFLGRAFVVNFNGVNTTITMMFKQAQQVVAEDITNTQADTLKDKHCNVFIKYQNGTAIIQYGVMTGDYYFDERHGADWLRNYIQTELYNLLYTTTTKIPQTDDGMNTIVTVINSCLAQAQNNGLVGSGTWLGYEFGKLKRGDVLPTGYYVYAPAMSTQTQADRDSRVSVPIQIAAKLQGAIHSIDVSITLNR